ncbi:MAG: CoA-binding protein [Candidatus Dactylopiibacterium sp.]|nr:CoA-binding protein [Candidatus Dactylopiibacterium sp.]
MENVVVIGASNNPERYSNKAMRMLAQYGHRAIPVAPAVSEVEGQPAVARAEDVSGPVDTVTLYVGPARQAPLLEGIVGLRPRRVIFNPGTENPDAYARLDAAGIPYLEACTLVLLRTGQF